MNRLGVAVVFCVAGIGTVREGEGGVPSCSLLAKGRCSVFFKIESSPEKAGDRKRAGYRRGAGYQNETEQGMGATRRGLDWERTGGVVGRG